MCANKMVSNDFVGFSLLPWSKIKKNPERGTYVPVVQATFDFRVCEHFLFKDINHAPCHAVRWQQDHKYALKHFSLSISFESFYSHKNYIFCTHSNQHARPGQVIWLNRSHLSATRMHLCNCCGFISNAYQYFYKLLMITKHLKLLTFNTWDLEYCFGVLKKSGSIQHIASNRKTTQR